MTSPRILCISLGSIGKRHLHNARKMLPDAEIAVYRQHTRSDRTIPEDADKVFTTLSQAVEFAPDAVIVSSPASEHLKCALPFVQENIPVFIEKPLADTAAGIDNFVAACRKSKGFVMVGYVLRFLPALHAMQKVMKDGILGDVYTVHIQVGQYLPDWRPESDYREGVSAQKKLGGGALLELSHEIDYATWLFGWPDALQASCARLSQLEIDVEDSANLLLEYDDKRIMIQLDFLQRVAHMAVQLVAEKGTLHADMMQEDLWLHTPENTEGIELEFDRLQNGNDIYLRQFDFFFAKALKDYRPVYPQSATFDQWASVEHAAGVLKLIDLAKNASETGVRQQVELKKAQAA